MSWYFFNENRFQRFLIRDLITFRDTIELKRKILESLMNKKGLSGTISIVSVPSTESEGSSDSAIPPVSSTSSVEPDLNGKLEADSVTSSAQISVESSETPDVEIAKDSLNPEDFGTLPFDEEPRAEASISDIQIDESIFQKTPFALPSVDSHTLNFIPHENPGKLPRP